MILKIDSHTAVKYIFGSNNKNEYRCIPKYVHCIKVIDMMMLFKRIIKKRYSKKKNPQIVNQNHLYIR